ncbi:MAG: uncharacterized protein A8A55_3293, partial [Amphiamblys sp. WSBS2006]
MGGEHTQETKGHRDPREKKGDDGASARESQPSAETIRHRSGGKPGDLKVVSWNTCGFTGKKIELEERFSVLNPDVLLLQETLVQQRELWIPGFQVVSQPAEDSPGKRGVAIAVRGGLSVKEVGVQGPHFCLGEIKGLFGKSVIGSVYIPCNEQTATMEDLGRAVGKLVVRKGQILLGGDWNLDRASLTAEVEKWRLDAKVIEYNGSPMTRHAWKNDRREWSTLDYFVSVGPVVCTKAVV